MNRWIGKFPSIKMKRMVGYQSLIERDFIYLLDFDPAVTTYSEQPLTIHYEAENKARRYTPDFAFTHSGRAYLVECKHHQFIKPDENGPKWVAARRWCTARGITFVVVTEAVIRAGYRLENVKLLTDYARYSIDEATTRAVLGTIAASPDPLTVAELMEAVSPAQPQAAITPILHLVYRRLLFIPLDEAPISVASLVISSDPAGSRAILPGTAFA